jgi:hypothetical protein
MDKNDLSQYVLGGELPPHSDNKNVVSQVRRYNGWLADKPDGGSTSPTWSPIAITCWRRWPR